MSAAVEGFDEKSRAEMQQWAEVEMSKAKVRSQIHNFTDLCFRKCVTSVGSAGTLSNPEASCVQNCVGRFLDTNVSIVKIITDPKRIPA